jgi:hypothetical protein
VSDRNIPNDQQLGEGFAFYRWHLLTFSDSECSYPERDNVCAREWDDMKSEALPALDVSEKNRG